MAKFLIENRPTLTCMIQAKTPDRIFELIDKGIAGGTDAFGVQLEVLERKYRTAEFYCEIFARMGDRPCYITNYNYSENEGISDDDLAEELLLVPNAAVLCLISEGICSALHLTKSHMMKRQIKSKGN